MGEMLRVNVTLPPESLTKETLEKIRAMTLSIVTNRSDKSILDNVTYEINPKKSIAVFTLLGTFSRVRQYHRALFHAALRFKGRVRMR